jgi:hypothetical protein
MEGFLTTWEFDGLPKSSLNAGSGSPVQAALPRSAARVGSTGRREVLNKQFDVLAPDWPAVYSAHMATQVKYSRQERVKARAALAAYGGNACEAALADRLLGPRQLNG